MDKIHKILTYAIGVVAVISAYMWVTLASNETPVASDVDSFYALTVIMLTITVGVTVIAALLQLVSNPKQLKQAAIVLVLVGVVVFISYSLASDKAIVFLGQTLSGSPAESKWVGTGLYATYITGVIAVLSIVLSPVTKLLK
ncbi:MAG: hypothetical protein KAH10_08800 [Flavobacteriales bacterium]|nr:hypothetical protein [Flavobacteriales bacterium]